MLSSALHYHHDQAQFTNQTGYSNPKVDDLLMVTAPDPARAAASPELKRFSRRLAHLVLFDEEGVDFASKKLNGLWAGIDSRDRWDWSGCQVTLCLVRAKHFSRVQKMLRPYHSL